MGLLHVPESSVALGLGWMLLVASLPFLALLEPSDIIPMDQFLIGGFCPEWVVRFILFWFWSGAVFYLVDFALP